MIKRILIISLAPLTCFAQFTPYGIGLVQQPNDRAARYYLRATNAEPGTNIVFSPGSYPGSIKINSPAGGGGGTVTAFSSGNLSPLFTTSVATPNTTPALSFALVSQNANLVYASPNGAPGNPSFRALAAADLPALSYVTSVGLALPVSVFSISGSPVTGAGTLTGSFQNQTANTVFAGPASGAPAVPTFRILSPSDIGVFTNHSDVVPSVLQPGQVMIYDGAGHWTNGGVVASVTLPDPLTNHTYSSNLLGVISNIVAGPFTNHSDVVPNALAAGDVLVWSGTEWTNAPAGTNAGGGGLSPGATTNFTVNWPDNNVYEFDEEFDLFRGVSVNQFSRYSGWENIAIGGGGGIGTTVNSNFPPYYGVLSMQSSTTPSNSVSLRQTGNTSGIGVYQDLAHATNWLFAATFFIHTTNKGSIYRIGLSDADSNTTFKNMFPHDLIGVRSMQNLVDGNLFVFQAVSNNTSVTVNSTVPIDIDVPFKFKMWSTEAGIVNFSMNGETPLTLTNTPTMSLGITCYVATTNATAHFLYIDRLSFRRTGMGR